VKKIGGFFLKCGTHVGGKGGRGGRGVQNKTSGGGADGKGLWINGGISTPKPTVGGRNVPSRCEDSRRSEMRKLRAANRLWIGWEKRESGVWTESWPGGFKGGIKQSGYEGDAIRKAIKSERVGKGLSGRARLPTTKTLG